MSDEAFDVGRFTRTLTLVLFVTMVFGFIAAERLSGDLFTFGVGAIAVVAFVTAMTSFLISAGQYYEDTPV